MAADLATLALVVDASGAERSIKLTTDQLKTLANGGREAQAVMKSMVPATVAPQMTAVQTAVVAQTRSAVQATQGLTQLRGAMTVLASQAVGLPGPLGRIASSLGLMGLGSPVMTGILAGIAAVGLAWQALTRDSRTQREENEKMAKSFRDMESGLSESAKRIRIATLEAQEATLKGRVDQGPAGFGRGVGMERWSGVVATQNFEKLKAELADVRARLGDLRTGLNKDVRDAASEAFNAAVEAAKKLREELAKSGVTGVNDALGGLRMAEAGLWTVGMDTIEREKQLSIARAQLQAYKETHAIEQLRATIGDKAADAAKAQVERALELKVLTAEITAEEAKQLKIISEKATKKQFWIGAGLGALGSFGGPMGGILAGGIQGGISGAAGGPLGIAAGAVMGLVGGIKALFQSSKDAARALQDFITQQKIIAGDLTQEQVTAGAVSERWARAIRDVEASQLHAQQQLAKGQITWEQFNAVMDSTNAKIAEYTDIQKRAAEATTAHTEELNRTMQEDLEVRRLRALGRDEEAEALNAAIERQREYKAAVDAGADATTLAAIAETQRVEAIKMAMDKIQARIDSLTGTIGGLQDFRNSLLLSDDAGLSPTAKLAEARRQYDEILAIAQGDDITKAQEAAGRLPAAAQALLNLSRDVNASGSGFQSDLQKVLTDNAALIARFQDLRTIEEEMLLELQRIRENTGGILDLGGTGIITTTGGTGGTGGGGGTGGRGRITPTGDADPLVTVSQAGFQLLSEKLDETNARLDGLTKATKDSGEQIFAAVRD